jgi:NADPH-dependent 2,4-dienoyl-CoA reductase/sulfur reductase-like enzyme
MRLVVIGAGFIGLEVAATARALGASVTVVEAAPTPLAGVLGTELGAWFADLHRAEGVEIRTSARVQEIGGRGRIESLVLADGSRIECDHVLVGVGVVPDTEWLAGSGLDDGGVRTDACGRTVAPGVYAAGDAALTYNLGSGRHARSDHWEAAARQGAAAARAMLGLDPAPALPPSFWSDQYGVRIQLVGHPRGADRVEYDGDPAARDFTAWLRRGDAPAAALLVGRPRALAAARRSIADALPTAVPT